MLKLILDKQRLNDMKLNISTDSRMEVYFYNDHKAKWNSVVASTHVYDELDVGDANGHGDIEINLVVYGRTATEALNGIKETLSKYGLAENIVYSQDEVDYIDNDIKMSWRWG